MGDWSVWNNVFSNVGGQIADAIRQKQQQEILNNILSSYRQGDKSITDIEGETKPVQVSFANPGYKPFSNKPLIPNFNPTIPDAGTVPAKATDEYVTAPIFSKTQNVPLSRTEKYNKQSDVINGILSSAITNTNISPENLQKVQLLAGILQNKANKNMLRTPNAFALPEGAQYYATDMDGNVQKVAENVKDFNKTTKDDKAVHNWTGADNYPYTLMMKPNGQTYTVKGEVPVREQKGTSVKVDAGTKEEKWSNIGDLITDIQQNSFYNKETGKIEKYTDVELKQAKDRARNTAYTHLTPSAKKWYDENIKGKSKSSWGREDLSNADFIAEVNEALKNGDISVEAHQDLLDFSAFRPDLWDLKTDSYHQSNQEKKKK